MYVYLSRLKSKAKLMPCDVVYAQDPLATMGLDRRGLQDELAILRVARSNTWHW
jgi:hypothetical protein